MSRDSRAPANVALFTVALDNIGPARAMLTLAQGLDRRRFTPHVVTALPFDDAVAGELARLEVPTAHLGTNGPFDLRAWWRLAGQLRRWRIDLVHARLQRAGFYARLAAPVAGRPVVLVNVVNMYGNHFASQHGGRLARPLLWAERCTASLVDVWVANSAAAASELESAIGVRAIDVPVVANAIDSGAFVRPPECRDRVRRTFGLAPGDLVLGTVARLVPLKRLELLLDAAALLRRDLPTLRLLIVGDGPSRAKLEAHARQCDAGAIFTGHRADVADLLSAIDVFAFASSSEGQPNVILEAMAAGLPVVAVDIPGLVGLVIPGETGELVDSKAGALTEALAGMLTDPARAAQMGRAGRAHVSAAFSAGRMVSAFEELYERALAVRAA